MSEPAYGEITDQGSGRRDAFINALTRFAKPISDAYDVWGRAVHGAMGQGPGVYDDEILPAGVTLGGFAMTGGLAATRPAGSIGAGGRPRIPLGRDQLKSIREMHANGRPAREIADHIGVSRPTVTRTIQREGLPMRGQGAPDLGRLLTREQEIELMSLLAKGEKQEYLAARYGVDPSTISKMADRYARDKSRNGMLIGGLGMAGSPYDEDTFMPMPNRTQGGPAPADIPDNWYGPTGRPSPMLRDRDVDRLMDQRNQLYGWQPPARPQVTPQGFTNDSEYAARLRGGGMQPDGGTDMEMMLLYGPEDQVAYDAQGRPIRLDDPLHPRNQRVNPMLESYPQQRRR